MSDDGAILGSFFFYSFFVFPTTSWILKPGRFPRQQAIIYAVSFLALLAAVKIGSEIMEKGDNHYVTLGVQRSSSAMDIKRAYKKLSLELHPDKSKSPTAAEDFQRVKQSYDVLMDVENRVVYNKFGDDGVKQNKSTMDEQQLLLEMGIFYATWFMMSYILTLGKTGSTSRNYIFTGLIVMLLVEITLMTTEDPFPEWFFPTMTEFEFIWLLHALFPAYMNGCRAMGNFLHVDQEENMKKVLFAMHELNKDMLRVMREVQLSVYQISKNGTLLPNASATTNTNDNENNSTVYSNSNQFNSPTPKEKLTELEEQIAVNNVHVAQAVSQLKNDGASNNSHALVAMILGYCVISYLFS